MRTASPPSRFSRLAGRVEEHLLDSAALRGNPLGDPHQRPLWVYLPPGYDDGNRRYPVVYVIQGYTGTLEMWGNRSPWRPTYPEAADALFARGAAPPVIVVWVDAWTAYGGSQYLDSPGTGRYHTYLCDEVVPYVDRTFHTLAEPAHRGIQGKSSGGYGAMVTPMLRPDLFGGLATHAGDALFEVCYAPGFPALARSLREEYAGDYAAFLTSFRARVAAGQAMARPSDGPLIEAWGYAAAYSCDEDGTVRLPFAPTTGDVVPEVWDRWLARDPVRMVPGHATALRGLRAIWVDAGTRDEYHLDLGALAFRRALEQAGITGLHFELFEAGHAAIDYRYPLSLAFLAERLAP